MVPPNSNTARHFSVRWRQGTIARVYNVRELSLLQQAALPQNVRRITPLPVPHGSEGPRENSPNLRYSSKSLKHMHHGLLRSLAGGFSSWVGPRPRLRQRGTVIEGSGTDSETPIFRHTPPRYTAHIFFTSTHTPVDGKGEGCQRMPKRRTRRAARRKELQEILDALMGMFKVHPIGTADHEKD